MGLDPITAFKQDNDLGSRDEIIEQYWPVVRTLLKEGYTVMLDTRKRLNYAGVVTTKVVGLEEHGAKVPLMMDDEEALEREEAIDEKRALIAPLLAKGDAIFFGCECDGMVSNNSVYKYTKHSPGRATYYDTARVQLHYEGKTPLGGMLAVDWLDDDDWLETVKEKLDEQDDDDPLHTGIGYF
jgi:hypothetical protein